MTETVRDLSFAERTTWGTCPVCGARHGEPCTGVNVQLNLDPKIDGAHYGRLSNAPFTVIEAKH